MWAIARSDHGLSLAEFGNLTLAQWEALEERRAIRLRHERFNAGLVASLLFNANRSPDSDPIEVWDFIPGFSRDPEEIEREKDQKATRHGVRLAFVKMAGMTLEQVRAESRAMVARMQAAGEADAEEVVRAIFEEMVQTSWEG